MKLSDGLLVAANAFLLLWSFVGFASTDDETLIVGAMLAMVMAVVNGVVFFRRRDREPTERRRHKADELDVHQVLDLDARLEALERAQSDAADAARWRALVESGQVTGPAAAAPTPDGPPTPRSARNGRA